MRSDKIHEALLGWADLSGDVAANRWDRLVVYATVAKDSFNSSELIQALQLVLPKVDNQALEQSLARLQLTFVLVQDDDGRYRYPVPLLKALILRDDPVLKLSLEV